MRSLAPGPSSPSVLHRPSRLPAIRKARPNTQRATAQRLRRRRKLVARTAPLPPATALSQRWCRTARLVANLVAEVLPLLTLRRWGRPAPAVIVAYPCVRSAGLLPRNDHVRALLQPQLRDTH